MVSFHAHHHGAHLVGPTLDLNRRALAPYPAAFFVNMDVGVPQFAKSMSRRQPSRSRANNRNASIHLLPTLPYGFVPKPYYIRELKSHCG